MVTYFPLISPLYYSLVNILIFKKIMWLGWLHYLCFPSWESKWGVTNLVIKGGWGLKGRGLRFREFQLQQLCWEASSGHFRATAPPEARCSLHLNEALWGHSVAINMQAPQRLEEVTKYGPDQALWGHMREGHPQKSHAKFGTPHHADRQLGKWRECRF